MVKYLSTDPNAGLEKPVKYLSMDPMAGLDIPKEEPKSAAYRFVHGMADTLNPVSMIQGLGDMAGRGLAAIDNKGVIGASVDAAKDAVDAQSRGFVNAWDLAGQGRTTEALGQAVSGALPVLGPMARDLGEGAAQTGDLATAMGRGVGLGVAPRVISNAPGVVGAVAKPVAAAAVKAAPALAAGAGTAALAGIAGASAPAAILAGLTGAIAEKVILPGKLAAAQRLISWLKGEGAAATPAEIAAKAEKAGLAEELKALRQESAVENKATRAEINRQKVMAQMDARRAAKEAKSAPEPAQPAAQAPEAPPAPVEAPPATVKAESSVHPGYQALVDAVKGKTQAEALKILAEQEVSSFLAPGILERAGVKAPEVVSDVVTRPHPGQRSPAFVDERLKYLQDQAAKRGTAPEEFKAKAAENKTKGAELAAALDGKSPVATSETVIPKEGQPFEFSFLRNNEKAPNMGDRFGQHIEPAGRYMQVSSADSATIPKNWQTGVHRFEKPLVVDFGGGYQEASNWKQVLSNRYGGKKGKVLSQAIRNDGYDGIVTVEPSKGPNRPAHTSEVVDLTSFAPKPTARQQGEALHAKAKARKKAKE